MPPPETRAAVDTLREHRGALTETGLTVVEDAAETPASA